MRTETGHPTVAAIALCVAFSACSGASHGARGDAGEIAVHVLPVAFDHRAGTPVVLLEEDAGDRVLPIWIGLSEARSIQAEIEGMQLPRPNSHDLAQRLVKGLRGTVERVVVTELRGGTFYAAVWLRDRDRTVSVDARPSDAIALALRSNAPVFVVETVFEDAAASEPAPEDRAQI